MSVHVIIEISIKDREMYGRYIQAVAPIVEKFGGRYLVRGGKITPLAGNWNPERIVVLGFDTVGQVNTWLASPEYAGVASLRENSTDSRAVIVESETQP